MQFFYCAEYAALKREDLFYMHLLKLHLIAVFPNTAAQGLQEHCTQGKPFLDT